MTEDEVLKIDEDAKAKFDALPLLERFSKTKVSAMVTKMQEEDAFETDNLIVLTMEEIVSREQEALASLTRQNDKTSGVWTLDILRDASLELRSAEKRRKVTKAEKELLERRKNCFCSHSAHWVRPL
jgi:hypothetical protein